MCNIKKILLFTGYFVLTILLGCSTSTDRNKDILLVQAATHGNTSKVIELIENGANPNYQGSDGVPILGKVLQSNLKNKLQIVSILVTADADVNARMYIVPISFGLLMQRDCDPKVLTYLLNHGLDVNAIEPATESGPLETALSASNIACAKILVEHGANVNAITRDGASPLLRAVGEGSTEMVQLLLTMHANPNAAMDNGVTPLILAATIRAGHIALLLLKYGANPCARNHYGLTASEVARNQNINGPGDQELAELLMCKAQTTNESGQG